MQAIFPSLRPAKDEKRFIYLDSAATTHKPLPVLERMERFLRDEYGTVHRGLYRRTANSTRMYEDARAQVARFLHAKTNEIIYTMGTTDAINLVAWSWGRTNLRPGRRVLVTRMEHHSNIVPWQLICGLTGAKLAAVPFDGDGTLDLEALERELRVGDVAMVSVVHVSNALGTINPITQIAALAHRYGALLLADCAQSAQHIPLDVTTLGADFLVFSGHKIYGPTGIGVLWGRPELLNAMPPWRGGGEMIERVTIEETTFAKPPARFEAGTPPIVEAIGLGAACEWLQSVGLERIHAAEQALYQQAETALAGVPGLVRYGKSLQRTSVLAFLLTGSHAADISTLLDEDGVCIRAGHHCAQTVMQCLGVPATARISLGVYSTQNDIAVVVETLHRAARILG